jgi:hypothetical protein
MPRMQLCPEFFRIVAAGILVFVTLGNLAHRIIGAIASVIATAQTSTAASAAVPTRKNSAKDLWPYIPPMEGTAPEGICSGCGRVFSHLEKAMPAKELICCVALILMAQAIAEAVNARPPTVTLKGYTPTEELRARTAATSAGYNPGNVLAVQAGGFFFNAANDGHSYALTVSPSGQV